MSQPITSPTPPAVSTLAVQRSTAHASLAALGVSVRHVDLFGPIHAGVHIAQKTVRYAPTDKLYDAFIALLAGAHGLVEINGRLRPDRALQAAFGRIGCAEQSVVQDTLDACTQETVTQLEAALDAIYRQQSQGYRHDYAQQWQILDVDMSGLPCGRKAALATPGYFAKQRNRRGRPVGGGVGAPPSQNGVGPPLCRQTPPFPPLPPPLLGGPADPGVPVGEAGRPPPRGQA